MCISYAKIDLDAPVNFGFGWHALSLRRAWAVLGDLASDGTIQSIKNASLSLDAEDEEVRWDVTVCIKLDFIVKSIRDSPRPSKTQGVPPNAVNLIS